jgi:hypothetical protein
MTTFKLSILHDGVLREATEAEVEQAKIDAERVPMIMAREARSQRNNLIAQSDWVTARAFETSQAVPVAWATYRQALRDITNQAGFPNEIQWPTQPE